MEITFKRHEKKRDLFQIISRIVFKPTSVYSLPIGLFSVGLKYIFSSLLIDPDMYRDAYQMTWLMKRAEDYDGVDKLSIFLNDNIFTNRLQKELCFDVSHSSDLNNKEHLFEYFSIDIPIIIQPVPNEKDLVEIILKQIKIDPKYTSHGFFPKFNFDANLKELQNLINTYIKFIEIKKIDNYPQDPYLNGPELFMCRNCESITFIESVEFNDGLYIYKAKCPNCKKNRSVFGPMTDTKLINATGSLFWICSADFTPYIIKNSKINKDKINLEMMCTACNKKVKKSYPENMHGIFTSMEGCETSEFIIEPNSNFVKYKSSNTNG